MKRSAKARKRASERAKLDAAFRKAIMERDGSRCQVDGYGEHSRVLHVSHFFAKGSRPWLRHDPDDACIMCQRHHMYWWHREPAEAGKWLEKYLGAKKYAALWHKAHVPPKVRETRRRE